MLGVVTAKRFGARAAFVEGTLGSGIRLNSARAAGLIRFSGIVLFENCNPVTGSNIGALPASEKLPWRSSKLGTATGETVLGALIIRLNSCENRKKVFSRSVLKRLGIVTGPLTRYPKLL